MRNYLLYIYGFSGALLEKVECSTQANAEKCMSKFKGYNAVGKLFSTKFSLEHGKIVPQHLIKTYHSK